MEAGSREQGAGGRGDYYELNYRIYRNQNHSPKNQLKSSKTTAKSNNCPKDPK